MPDQFHYYTACRVFSPVNVVQSVQSSFSSRYVLVCSFTTSNVTRCRKPTSERILLSKPGSCSHFHSAWILQYVMERKEPLVIADDFQLPLEAFAIPPQYQVSVCSVTPD